MARLTRIAAATQTSSHLLSSSYAPIPAQRLSSLPTFSLEKRPRSLFIIIPRLTHFHLHSFDSTLIPRSFPLFSITSPSTISHSAARGLISFSSSTRFTVDLGHRPFGDLAALDSSDSNPRPDWTPLRDKIFQHNYPMTEGYKDMGYWLVMPNTIGYEFETKQALFDFYIKTLAPFVGSNEEAKRRIYFVSTEFVFGFGAKFDEETALKILEYPGVDIGRDPYALTRNPKAQSDAFTPVNWNHRVDDILSYHHLSEYNLQWSSDYWLVHIKQPDGEFVTRQRTVDLCLRMLAHVVGSEKDALMKLYAVWCKTPFGFGAEIDEQTVTKLQALPNVLLVLPDYAFDVDEKRDPCKFALVVSPLYHLKSDSTYGYYQPSQAHSSKNPSMESLDESGRFTLMDQNRCLGNIFSYHHLSKQNPQWNFDHWLIVIKLPEGGFMTEGQILDFYVQILAEVIGSEHEAKEKICIIWCKYPCGFGAEVSGETSNKLQGCPHVLKVLPDYAFNVKDKVSGD